MVLRKNRHLQQHRSPTLRWTGIAMIAAGALVFLLATVSGIAYSLGWAGLGAMAGIEFLVIAILLIVGGAAILGSQRKAR